MKIHIEGEGEVCEGLILPLDTSGTHIMSCFSVIELISSRANLVLERQSNPRCVLDAYNCPEGFAG